ncbi:MAG: S26 family signal peptidase [Planctomycetaceae bacterium]
MKPARVTGASMSPTIWGDHAVIQCQGCRVQWKANWQAAMRPSGSIACWNCGFQWPAADYPPRPGDVVRIDTAAYRSSPPNINDIVAIRDASNVRIKRIVGVPGQVLSARSGILFRDGHPLTSAAPWIVVHDDTFRRDDVSWWQAAAPDLVTQTPTGFDVQAGADPALLLYGHRSPYDQLRPDRIRDDYAGNLSESRWLREVTMVGVQADVDVSAAATLHGWMWTAQGAVRETRALPQGHQRLDLRWTRPDPDVPEPPQGLDAQHPIALNIEHGSLSIRNLRVIRPILYWIDESSPGAVELPLKIEDDHFFLVGDNVPLSVDSRQAGPVTRSQIIGKVIPSAGRTENPTAVSNRSAAVSDD